MNSAVLLFHTLDPEGSCSLTHRVWFRLVLTEPSGSQARRTRTLSEVLIIAGLGQGHDTNWMEGGGSRPLIG